MLVALTLILLFQLAGLAVVVLLGLPVPAPVMGMFLFVLGLMCSTKLLELTRTTANTLLAHLAVLFVPAGVGIVEHVDRLQNEWVAIVTALVVSTVLAMVVTVYVIRWTKRLLGQDTSRHA